MKRRWIAIVLSVCMLAQTGCSSSDELTPGNGKWRDSDINGSVKAEDEIRLQDDYAAAVNRDWILQHGDNDSVFTELMRTGYRRKQAILDDPSLKDKTARELKKYAAFAVDQKARDEAGVEPLKKYIDEIEGLGSRDEIFAYISDPGRNPLGAAPVQFGDKLIHSNDDHPDEQALQLVPAKSSVDDENFYYDLRPVGLEQQEIHEGKVYYLLGRMGYDKDRIGRILRGNYRVEKKIQDHQSHPNPGDLAETWWSGKQLVKMTKGYPMAQFLEGWGFSGRVWYCGDEKYLKKVGSIMENSSEEEIKAFLITQYLNASADWLDSETDDKLEALNKPRMDEDEPEPGSIENELRDKTTREQYELFDEIIGQSAMMAAMDKLYVQKYYDDEASEDLYRLTEMVIEGLRKMFSEEDWLSGKGRKACIRKLDAIRINVVRPNIEDVDYSDLTIVPKKQGGTYLDAALSVNCYGIRHLAKRVKKPYSREYWDPYESATTTTQINAFYYPSKNGIYILQGIAEEPVYNPRMTIEEKLGGIGAIIGHELTHGFDAGGSQFDKDGNYKKWLPQEDQMEFESRTMDVSNYYSLITPFKNSNVVDGDKVQEEATADMGGLRATLTVAKEIGDFDYDQYFRAFAGFYATQRSREDEGDYVSSDEHPLSYLRINVGVQQFGEFYQTYDVKSTDNMYLEEKNRISVW